MSDVTQNFDIIGMEKELLTRETAITPELIAGYEKILATTSLSYARGDGGGQTESNGAGDTSKVINGSFFSRALIEPQLLTDAVIKDYVEIAAVGRSDDLRHTTQETVRKIAALSTEHAERVFRAIAEYDTEHHKKMFETPARYAEFLKLERGIAEKLQDHTETMEDLYSRFSGYVLTSKPGMRRETLKTYAFAAAASGHAEEGYKTLKVLNDYFPETAILRAMGLLGQVSGEDSVIAKVMDEFKAAAASKDKEIKAAVVVEAGELAVNQVDKMAAEVSVPITAITLLSGFASGDNKPTRRQAFNYIGQILDKMPAQDFKGSLIEKAISGIYVPDTMREELFGSRGESKSALQNKLYAKTKEYQKAHA